MGAGPTGRFGPNATISVILRLRRRPSRDYPPPPVRNNATSVTCESVPSLAASTEHSGGDTDRNCTASFDNTERGRHPPSGRSSRVNGPSLRSTGIPTVGICTGESRHPQSFDQVERLFASLCHATSQPSPPGGRRRGNPRRQPRRTNGVPPGPSSPSGETATASLRSPLTPRLWVPRRQRCTR